MGRPGLVVDLPCVTRPKGLIVALLLLVLVALGVGATASAGRSPARSEAQLRTLNRQIASAINTFRTAHGLVPLIVSPELNASARQHSVEMGANGYFDHPSKDGTSYWKRIKGYYTADGYPYWTVGENLLWSSPTISATEAVRLWARSPGHLRNLKNANWRNLGVSSVKVLHAGGVYGGYTVTIITTDFGARH